ncbi:MAG: hypothetical protein R3F31_03505 [Verrucomicrobiales bacterium]
MTTGLNGQSRSLEVFAEDPLLLSENIHPQPLLYADGRFWGETDFLQEPFVYDSKQDHGAPISLAASVERGRIDDPKLEHKTSRLVVVANPDIIDPKGNTAKVNSDFLMASLNWTINRASLSGISPSPLLPSLWKSPVPSPDCCKGWPFYPAGTGLPCRFCCLAEAPCLIHTALLNPCVCAPPSPCCSSRSSSASFWRRRIRERQRRRPDNAGRHRAHALFSGES